MHGKLSASIVIYKSNPQFLTNAVESFLNSTDHAILYLIDNSPTDFFRNYFQDPRIRYTFNNRNVGFGAGHNIALQQIMANSESDFHIVLNPDVYFEKNTLHTLYSFLLNNRNVGLVMPKILYPDGRLQPLCRLLPSPVTLIGRRFLRFNKRWLSDLNHWYEMHFSGYNTVMDVPFLSGCFMFLRIEALKQVGLFDESIFLYTEDIDLSRRIHRHYRTVFYPDAVVYHHHQRESYKKASMLLHHTVGAITYFNKWGWFRDDDRDRINKNVLLQFQQ